MPSKLRAQQIIIDLPQEEGEVWLHATLQRLVKDENYETLQRMDRVEQTHRRLSAVALQTHTLVDPVTQQEYTISGAGVAAAIKAFVVGFIQEDHGGTINELGDLIE